jgi:DNA-binding response OmpR family regulator
MDVNPLIQIIDDNPTFTSAIKNVLEIEGYRVRVDHEGVSGLAFARLWAPDLVLLDLLLPDMNGYDVLKALRAAGRTMPVLILTARCDEAEKVLGFRTGADDFVTKPFSLMELLARIVALLRRSRYTANTDAGGDRSASLVPDIEINLSKRTVTRFGAPVELAPKEFDLLVALAVRGGAVVSRHELLREVWGHRDEIVTRTVDAHILSLRKKIEFDPTDPELILTARQAGYRLALGAPRLVLIGAGISPATQREWSTNGRPHGDTPA